MARIKDITGQVFTKLTAISYQGNDKDGNALWLFHCSCGGQKIYKARSVKKGEALSCGCKRAENCAKQKLCRHCGLLSDRKNRHGNMASVCQKCSNKQTNHFKVRNPKYQLVASARHRAKKYGLPCTITHEDFEIPERCPILGIELEFGTSEDHNAAPSLDRIVPQLGYIPENIAIISHRANQIKNNGTADEHRQIADWIDANKPDLPIPEVTVHLVKKTKKDYAVRPSKEFSDEHRSNLSKAAQARHAREKAAQLLVA